MRGARPACARLTEDIKGMSQRLTHTCRGPPKGGRRRSKVGVPATCPAGAHGRVSVSATPAETAAARAGPGRATDELQEVLVGRGREDVFLEQNSSRGAGRSHSDVLTVRVRDSGV